MEYFIAVYLFAGGIVIGLLSPGSNFFNANLIEYLGAFSSLATIGAAFVAYRTLRDWKKHFTNSKKHDALIGLEAALFGLDVYRVYSLCFRDICIEGKSPPEGEKIKILDDYRKKLETDMASAFRMYSAAWNTARVFLDDVPDISSFSPEAVRSEVLRKVIRMQTEYDERCRDSIDAGTARALDFTISSTCSNLGISVAQIIHKGTSFLQGEIRKTIA